MTRSAVLLVAEDVLVRLCLRLNTDQRMLRFKKALPLADSSRGTC